MSKGFTLKVPGLEKAPPPGVDPVFDEFIAPILERCLKTLDPDDDRKFAIFMEEDNDVLEFDPQLKLRRIERLRDA